MLIDCAQAEPMQLGFDEINENDRCLQSVVFDRESLDAFTRLTGDQALVHTDEGHAKKMGYPRLVVHGFLVASAYSRMLGMYLPGPHTVIQSVKLDMLHPVCLGDKIRYEVTVVQKTPSVRAVKLQLAAYNENQTPVSRGVAQCVFRI